MNETKKKASGLSVWALVLTLLVCTSFIGLILAIVDLAKKDETKKHTCSKVALVLCVLQILCGALLIGGMGSGDTAGDTKEVVESSTDYEADTEGEAAETENSFADVTSAEKITIEEQVLFDGDGIKITATEYEQDSIWGDGIKLLLENNSDRTVNIGCNALIVNDYMITDLFASEIAPGKKANETMHLSSSGLRAAGIDSVGQVEIYFHIYDSETWDTIADPDCVTIQTSAYENMDTTVDDAGTELYNNGGIRIVGKTVDENSFWGSAVLLYCENTSGKNVGISVEELSVNGFMMSPLFSSTVYDGKKALDSITLLSTELEENGITSVENVELKFHIYDADSYNTIEDTETISFSAK